MARDGLQFENLKILRENNSTHSIILFDHVKEGSNEKQTFEINVEKQ